MKIIKITLEESIENEKYIVGNGLELNLFDSLSEAKVGFIRLDGLMLGEKLDLTLNTKPLTPNYSDGSADVKRFKEYFLKNNFWWGDVLGKKSSNGYLHLHPRNGKIEPNNLVGFVYAPINAYITKPHELLLIALKRVEIALNKETHILH